MISLAFSLIILGGIGFAVWTMGSNVLSPSERASLDYPRVAKSAAIALAMYLASLAIVTGLVNLLQALFGGTRIEGSSADLALGMSLLIVAAPVFTLLLRLVIRQQEERRALGDLRPGIGWSIHFVLATATLLIGILGSVEPIVFAIGRSSQSVESEDVVSTLGWLGVWSAYWFGVRPRLGVRGHIHLLFGSIVGLAALVGGMVAASGELLDQAYDSLFKEVVSSPISVVESALIALIGAIVWIWHWRILDGRGSHVESEPRTSGSWYAMTVGFAIVPAVIAMVFCVIVSLVVVVTWFLGTPNEGAADWFDPVPAIVVAALASIAVWAYHRAKLLAQDRTARTESDRFHDYAVAAVGLGAVTAGLARLVNHVFLLVTSREAIADSYEIDNELVITICLLAVGAGLWWLVWRRIETHRQAQPEQESNSVWRKVYLIVAAGIGGLVLTISAIWVLFAFFQDLFDGTLGIDTLSALSGPIGWLVAVLAGVWYHLGIWRSDRTIMAAAPESIQATDAAAAARPDLASQPGPDALPPGPDALSPAPGPPPPGNDMPSYRLEWRASADRDGELFTLQRAAFVDEAMAYETPLVPALTETFDAFAARTAQLATLVAVDDGRVVGAVSTRTAEGVPWLERLMVVPDRRHERIGRNLVLATADELGANGYPSLRAVVGDRDPRLVAFYESIGFRTIGKTPVTDTAPELLVMQRVLNDVPPAAEPA